MLLTFDLYICQLSKLPPGHTSSHFDTMATLAHHKYNDLLSTIPEMMVGKKVLAAIIMQRNGGNSEVVSVGTGRASVTGPNEWQCHNLRLSQAEIALLMLMCFC